MAISPVVIPGLVSIPQRDFRELQGFPSLPATPWLQFQSLKGILGNCKRRKAVPPLYFWEVSIPQRDFRELQASSRKTLASLSLTFQSLKGILGNCKNILGKRGVYVYTVSIPQRDFRELQEGIEGGERRREVFQSLKGILGNCKTSAS